MPEISVLYLCLQWPCFAVSFLLHLFQLRPVNNDNALVTVVSCELGTYLYIRLPAILLRYVALPLSAKEIFNRLHPKLATEFPKRLLIKLPKIPCLIDKLLKLGTLNYKSQRETIGSPWNRRRAKGSGPWSEERSGLCSFCFTRLPAWHSR